MEFRYLGFDQQANARAYRFDSVAKGEPTRCFTVTADMGLFLQHRVGIQEGPNLCAHKLASALESSSGTCHELTGEDLRAYVTAAALAAAQKAGSRKNSRRPGTGFAASLPLRTPVATVASSDFPRR